jgi:hypothetical protein
MFLDAGGKLEVGAFLLFLKRKDILGGLSGYQR